MSKLLPLFFLLLCIGCCLEGSAQEYRAFARRYGIEDGLPHRQVNSIIQDHRGFLWAATNAGVLRFDGHRFKVFSKTNGLTGDLVDWVAEDARGFIWACRAGPNGWLCIIDPLSGNVVPTDTYFRQQPLPAPVSRWWKAPRPMADGSLLIGLYNPGGLLRFHPDSGGWSRIPLPECRGFMLQQPGPRQSVWGYEIPLHDSVSILREIDLQGRVLREIRPPLPGWSFWEKEGHAGGANRFFVLTYKKGETPVLWEIDEQGQHRPAPLYTDNTYSRQHARLAGSGIEVQFPGIYDRSGKLLLDISREYPEIDLHQYRDYLVDHNGNLWFATTFGLIVVELRKNHFRRLLYEENAPGGRGKACRGLLEKNGQLLVNLEAAGQGRYRVNPRTGQSERLPGECAIGIAPGSDGGVWTECITGPNAWQTLSLYKATADGRLSSLQLFQKRDFGYIWTILEDSPQRVLLGHANGMTVYNPQTGHAGLWQDEQFPAFNQANISWLGKDRSGQIWACTEQGLFQLKPGGGVVARYWSGGQGAYYLPYDHIYHFYEDAAGIFWLGTSSGGLLRWDRRAPVGQQTQVIYRENGLLNGVVYAVYEDNHQHLWLPTDYGIVQLDKKSLQVRHTWLTTDGLTHNEFNRVSHCQGADGTLYFGGLNGVTAFNPNDFYADNSPDKGKAALVISNFSVLQSGSGRLENQTPELLDNNRITIGPDDRYAQLEFALLEYFAPEKSTYTWQLEGLSTGWEGLKEPVLRLSGLPFGSYRLRIRAQAADGSSAGNELSIELRVLPPVYLRWWFFVLLLGSLGLGLRAWYLWRTREHRREQERLEAEVSRQTATIRRQTEELQKLDETKSRFFANISHELRTPLTLMLGPLSSLLRNKRLDATDQRHAEMAHEHGRQLL